MSVATTTAPCGYGIGYSASLLRSWYSSSQPSFCTSQSSLDVVAGVSTQLALTRAYNERGVTDDIATHDNPSPTIRDVMDVLERMVEEPEEFVVRTDEGAGKLAGDAT